MGEKKETQAASVPAEEIFINESELDDDIAKMEKLMDRECVAE